MKRFVSAILHLTLLLGMAGCGNPETQSAFNKPEVPEGIVALYTENPRYIEYKGKPTILITSAEHYGAVVNLDFDYSSYLQTLSEEGFNYTRIFTGTYIESEDNIFGIQKNTLGPQTDRYIAPWLKVDGKYDLEQFNPAFFDRLKDFLSQAEQLEIVVEITLFSSIYANNSWELMPFHPENNINQTGVQDYHRVNTLFNGNLKKYQERLIRKVVGELNGFENIFYEIQNEPWADNGNLADFVNEEDDSVFSYSWQKKVELANEVSLDWQEWVAGMIEEEESAMANKHVIAQNISNFQYKQGTLPPGISMINFHYALPDAVQMNLDLGGVIGLDETGFMPKEDRIYLNQAWRFILSGGGLYNNLDYSFTAEHAKGTWPIQDSNPGWGGPGFRKKLSYLVKAIEDVPFYEMNPTRKVFRDAEAELGQFGLMKEGELYLIFLEDFGNSSLIPEIPAGNYQLTWLHLGSGEIKTEQLKLDGTVPLTSPFVEPEVVIKIEKTR